MTQSPRRECPVCGRATSLMVCPDDGASTREISAEAAQPLVVGDVVHSRYEVVSVIGGGGFSVVYRAKNVHTGEAVALKVMRHRLSDDAEVIRKRFLKEVKILGRLQSRGTVRVFDAGLTETGQNFLVMELLVGPNLKQLMSLSAATQRPLKEAQVIDVIAPILESLAEAHKLGLVHRDLKPANVMLTSTEEDPLLVKVVDFGVAKTTGSDLTSQRTSLGTPRYMSPEQCRGEPVDARSDIYSIGCVLFEALTGTPPFKSRNHVDTMWQQVTAPVPDAQERVRYQLSPEIRSVLRLSMAKDPDKRFASATAMGRALERIRETRWTDAPATELKSLLRGHGPENWRAALRDSAVNNEPVLVNAKKEEFGDTVSVDLDEPLELSKQELSPPSGALGELMAVALAQGERVEDVSEIVGGDTVDLVDDEVAAAEAEAAFDVTPAAWDQDVIKQAVEAAKSKAKADGAASAWAKGTLVGTGFSPQSGDPTAGPTLSIDPDAE